MKELCVGIYGETCSGKSTLGKRVSERLNCGYISFGDLKRDAINKKTELGLTLKKILDLKCPLPAELGYEVVRNKIANGLNIISGYPISIDEFNVFSKKVRMVGIVILGIDEKTLIQRFGLRRECPKCNIPGIIADSCPIHKVQMVQRENVSIEELIMRRNLYRERIIPFLESRNIGYLPRILLDSGTLSKEVISFRVSEWIKERVNRKGG